VIVNPFAFGQAEPEILGVSTGVTPTGFTHTVLFPVGTEMGEVVVVAFRQRSTVTTVNLPAGWTDLGGTQAARCFARKLIAGDSLTQVVVSIGASRTGMFVAFRIAPASGGLATAVAGSFDPPALAPAFGTSARAWLAIATKGRTDSSFTAGPAGFGGFATFQSVPGQANIGEGEIAWATVTDKLASRDPTAFTVGGTTANSS
jgi:hypothetical protein